MIREIGMTAKTENELWDIYTKDRVKTGRLHRRGERMQDGEYHMVIHVCIFNSRNELLIQQRQPFKKGWSNMWDITVGGSALQGESSSQAAEREVFEEIGLKLLEQEVDLEGLRLQEEEVLAVSWASKEVVMQMQEQGTMIPYWFLDRLFEVRGYDAHGRLERTVQTGFAAKHNLASWMSLVEIVRENFPGLETQELLDSYRETVIKNIERQSAICALHGRIVVGILLFSVKHNMISCMAVHPEYRRRGIAREMIALMMTKLDRTQDITVTTFREDDPKGTAPRALYASLGFVPAGLCVEQGYPSQVFVLKGEQNLI